MTKKPERRIHFAPEAILKAQDAKGLTDKDVADALGGLSARQWSRWKNSDAVPASRCLAVVLLLGLPQPKELADADRTPWAILEALEGLSQGLEDVAAVLRRLDRR